MALSGRDNQRGRLLSVVFAAAIWIGVVVVGAGKRTEDPLLGVDNMEIVWTVMLGLAVLLSLVALVILRPSGLEATEDNRRHTGWLVLLVFLGLLWWKPELLRGLINEDQSPTGEVGVVAGPEPELDEVAVETVAQLTDILLVLAGLAAIAGVWWFATRRVDQAADQLEEVDAVTDEQLEDDLVEAIDSLSFELRSDDDPRTTIIRAYAILEGVLAQRGLRRAPSETHAEHIRRALRGLRVEAEPFAQLGVLYERARFSQIPVAVSEQRQAAEALEAARQSLTRPA
jgi:hypothetical protein